MFAENTDCGTIICRLCLFFSVKELSTPVQCSEIPTRAQINMSQSPLVSIVSSFERSSAEAAKSCLCLDTQLATPSEACKTSSMKSSATDLCLRPFLDAFQELMGIFDIIGSPLLGGIIRKDVANKIHLIHEAAAKDGNPSTVRQLVIAESLRTTSGRLSSFFQPVSASMELAWMARVLQFVERLISNLLTDSHIELSEAALAAYRDSLRNYQPAITRAVFERALNFLPSRASFEENISKDSDSAKELLSRFAAVLGPHVVAMRAITQNICKTETESKPGNTPLDTNIVSIV